MIARLLLWLLKSKRLSKDDRLLLTRHLLTTVSGVPLHGILMIDGGGNLLIRGVKPEAEQLITLRQHADALQSNLAWKLIREQVLYQAISLGAFEGTDVDQILFSRAGVWFGQKEKEWVDLLAGTATDA